MLFIETQINVSIIFITPLIRFHINYSKIMLNIYIIFIFAIIFIIQLRSRAPTGS